MPTTNPTNQATSSVLTTICGTGPLMVLDLAAVPVAAMLPIVKAALRVAEEWDAANIGTPEYEGAEEALTAYSTRWRTRFHADGGQCSSVMADTVPR